MAYCIAATLTDTLPSFQTNMIVIVCLILCPFAVKTEMLLRIFQRRLVIVIPRAKAVMPLLGDLTRARHKKRKQAKPVRTGDEVCI